MPQSQSPLAGSAFMEPSGSLHRRGNLVQRQINPYPTPRQHPDLRQLPLRHQRSFPDRSSELRRQVAEAEHRAELARQEHLFLQQEHERARLRERLRTAASEFDHYRDVDDDEDDDMPANTASPAYGSHRRIEAQSHRAPEHAHQVYLLNCRGCDNFLTDRGMRAVLLLKPHVTLFSTDVMPANCGPLYPPTQTFGCSTPLPGSLNNRTCECLTQTLGCYGCGAQVGYQIISPCSRCTASISDSQRGSNGHRIVLHCSELTVRVRRYVPGEPGVLCASQPPPRTHPLLFSRPGTSLSSASSSRVSSPIMPTAHGPIPIERSQARGTPHFEENLRHRIRHALVREQGHAGQSSMGDRRQRSDTEASSPRIVRTDPEGNPISPLSEEHLWSFGLDPHLTERSQAADDDADLDAEKAEAAMRWHEVTRAHSQPSYFAADDFDIPSKAEGSANGPRRIPRGGLVYWNDLVSGGERSEPIDSDVLLRMPIAGR